MQTPSDEICVNGKIKLFLDEENILNVISLGDIDKETALECNAVSRKLSDTVPGKIKVLVDLNKGGKESPEARKIFKDMKYNKEADVALFGMHPVAKLLASLYMKFSKIQNVRFFDTREDALAWLRSIE